ncbi:MAG: 2-oxo acid dehydrogenase subunit E2 [Planctomycetia bacterium]|nr:2-oxo acid dehydrogenase subunit E2 [Planctomycetia bacterium]
MDFRVPELGEGVYEAELVDWRVKPGDTVKRGQYLMEVLTDKATMEVPSPFAGTIAELKAQPGQPIKIGDVVLTYHEPGQETKPGKAEVAVASNGGRKAAAEAATLTTVRPAALESRPQTPSVTPLRVAASPSVRHLARKLGIDLTRLRGSGPQGRILLDDLAGQVSAGTPAKPPAVKPVDYGTPGTRVRLAGIRRKIAEHMVHSKRTIPHYSYIDECDVTDLLRLREQLKEPLAKQGVKLTYLAFFVKAVTLALKEVPIVNATLDESSGEIVLHDRYHVGIAVAAPGGLVVPVVHDADQKDLVTLARDIERLSSAAREGKSKLEDLRGGTFTVTSIGNVGGLISTPVINHPEVGILGVGKIVKRPVFDAAGNVKPADLVYLSLSFDHRVVDGAVGAAFGNAVIRQLQSPAALLLPTA